MATIADKEIAIKTTKNLNIRKHVLQEGYSGSFLKDYYFEGCMYEQCSSKNLKFQRVSFIGCDFINCIFDTCRMEDCIFEHCNFFSTIFLNSYLSHCKISDTAFLNCQICGSMLQDPHIYVSGTKFEQKAYYGAIQRLFNHREDVKSYE